MHPRPNGATVPYATEKPTFLFGWLLGVRLSNGPAAYLAIAEIRFITQHVYNGEVRQLETAIGVGQDVFIVRHNIADVIDALPKGGDDVQR